MRVKIKIKGDGIKMRKKIYRDYDKKEGLAVVVIMDKYGVSIGRAKVHEEDKDLESEKTGLAIAEMKAKIERARKRLVKNKKELDAASTQMSRLIDYKQESQEMYDQLKEELNHFLEEKEIFRKNYRKMKSRKQGTVEK